MSQAEPLDQDARKDAADAGDPPESGPRPSLRAPAAEAPDAWLAREHAAVERFVDAVLDRRRDLSPESAREVRQDAYVTLLEHGRAHGPPRKIEALLVTILGHLVSNRGRRRKRRGGAADVAPEELPARNADAEALAVRAEELRALETACAGMKPGDVLVIELIDLDGMSYQDVADRLGIGRDAAYKRHRRALLRLGKLVRELST